MAINRELLKNAEYAVLQARKVLMQKRSFVPSPGMMGGGGGGMPSMDPAMMGMGGGMGGGGGMPSMDPAMMGMGGGMGGGGGMPSMDPAMMGGGGGMPPMDPNMMMAMMGGGGAPPAPPADPSLAGAIPEGAGAAPVAPEAPPAMPAGVQDKDKLLQTVLKQNGEILKYVLGGAAPAGGAEAAPKPAPAEAQPKAASVVLGSDPGANAEMLSYLSRAREALKSVSVRAGTGIVIQPPKPEK